MVPDEGLVADELPLEQYIRLLQDFDERVAGPAAELIGGMTQMGTSKHTLSDYFSQTAVDLLDSFCRSANKADLGTHPLDQHRWMAFLLDVHRNDDPVHCDTFRGCLATSGWWPERGIDRLVREFDFAMRLLRQAEESSGHAP
jgi:hypothetical protein